MPRLLHEAPGHLTHHFDVLDLGHAIPANQFMISIGDEAVLLDPGGTKAFRYVYPQVLAALGRGRLTHLFLSHQDPDIISASKTWQTMTDATAYLSELWVRFIPYYGLGRVVAERTVSIPDEGGILTVGGVDLLVLPAHFLHASGNFQLYDPVSRILFSGDLGASITKDLEVADFDAHVPKMAGFHARYMAHSRAMSMWAAMVRQLDVDVIAPQHGAAFVGKPMVERFIDWCDGFTCGTELLGAARA